MYVNDADRGGGGGIDFIAASDSGAESIESVEHCVPNKAAVGGVSSACVRCGDGDVDDRKMDDIDGCDRCDDD